MSRIIVVGVKKTESLPFARALASLHDIGHLVTLNDLLPETLPVWNDMAFQGSEEGKAWRSTFFNTLSVRAFITYTTASSDNIKPVVVPPDAVAALGPLADVVVIPGSPLAVIGATRQARLEASLRAAGVVPKVVATIADFIAAIKRS